MKIETKKLPKSQVEIIVELSGEELAPYFKKAAEEISRQNPIKGFRPGGAPPDVVEKSFGQGVLFQRAADKAVKSTYVKAILEGKLNPVAEPTVEIVPTSGEGGLRYKAISPVLPQIDLPDWRKIKIKENPAEVEEKDVQKALETLQRSRAVYATVSRPAQEGDRVEIDFKSLVAGVPIDGGASKQHPLIVGEGHFLGGFEDKLVGMKEGETKKFSLKAPKDYPKANLAGKTIDFTVTMRLVQSVGLPALDDEFAGKLGKFASLADLKKSVREGLLEEKKGRMREKTRVEMVEKILEKTPKFEIPDLLVEQETKKMEQELSSSLARMGLDQASYLAHIKKSAEELRKGWGDQAEKRVRAGLVLSGIAQKEGIAPSKQEVEQKISELVSDVPQENLQNIDTLSLEETVEGLLRNEKVFELLENDIIVKN